MMKNNRILQVLLAILILFSTVIFNYENVFAETNNEKFIRQLTPAALKNYKDNGILPSITLGQMILESGFGTSELSRAPYYNLFGIKAGNDWAGNVYIRTTTEYINDKYVTVQNKYRVYNSYEESVSDYGKLFTSTNWRRNNYKTFLESKTYIEAADRLQAAGYASTPNYSKLLKEIIEKYRLYNLDVDANSNGQFSSLSVNGWQKDTNGRWRYIEKGVAITHQVKEISNHLFHFKNDGQMSDNEWVLFKDVWYYAKQDGYLARDEWIGDWHFGITGAMTTNQWVQYKDSWYYLKSDGVLAKNETIDGYVVDATGKWLNTLTQWRKDKDGHWRYIEKGAVVSYQIKEISNHLFHFKNDGQMSDSEWVLFKDVWYYAKQDGYLARDEWIGDWHFGITGAMTTNQWIQYKDSWYYLKSDGVLAKNETIDGYVIDATGKRQNKRDIEEDRKTAKMIFLDPGHGGIDSGAYYFGIKESDVALKVSQKLTVLLENAGYIVKASRDSDRYADLLTDRSQVANEFNADLFISLHFNASGTGEIQGIETYWYQFEADYLPKINEMYHNNEQRLKNSELLANLVQNELIAKTKANNRGIKRNSFSVLRETKMPAILIELGFLDNEQEIRKIKDDSYLQILAEAIFNGIKKYTEATNGQ